jgi:hypothetical protein
MSQYHKKIAPNQTQIQYNLCYLICEGKNYIDSLKKYIFKKDKFRKIINTCHSHMDIAPNDGPKIIGFNSSNQYFKISGSNE